MKNNYNPLSTTSSKFPIPPCPWLQENFYFDDAKINYKGKGANAHVYEMINRKDGLHYAVKIIQLSRNEKEDTNKFLEEIKLVQDNPHKNIIETYDYHLWEADKNLIYLILISELALASLNTYIKNKKILSELEFYGIVDQLFEGLNHCHSKKITHFDIKPANILLFDNNVVKFGDFGSAKQTLGEGTFPLLTNSIFVTELYASPEILKIFYAKETYDKNKSAYNWNKADVYSLALTILTLIGVKEQEIRDFKGLQEPHYSFTLRELLKTVIKSQNYQVKWVDLIAKMLEFDYKLRVTIGDAKKMLNEMSSTNKKDEMIKKIFDDHATIELVFVLDITGSMDPFIKGVLISLKHNIKELKKVKAKRKIKIAIIFFKDKMPLKQELVFSDQSDFDSDMEKNKDFFLEASTANFHKSAKFLEGLREYNDYIQILDFSTDIAFIEKKLSKAEKSCKGGMDTCEDLTEALQAALTLEWNPDSKMKTIVIITDAPTHGKRYHDPNILDDFPDDDQKINNLEDSVNKLCKKHIGFVCLQIKPETNLMFNIINSVVQKHENGQFLMAILDKKSKKGNEKDLNKWFENAFLDDVDSIFSNQWKLYFDDKIRDSLNWNKQIDWESFFQPQQIIGCDFKVYSACLIIKTLDFYHLNELEIKSQRIKKNEWLAENSGWVTKNSVLKGSQKIIYLIQRKENLKKYVIKIPLAKPIKNKKKVENDWKIYLLTKMIHEDFKKRLNGQEKHFNFVDLLIIKPKDKLENSKYLMFEEFLEGIFIKYNNNNGWHLPLKEGETYERNKLSQAFSHFSYEFSKGRLVICDLQGVGNQFTDPAINSIELAFGKTDLGGYGIYKFFKTHQCNEFCMRLDLPDTKKIVNDFKEQEVSEEECPKNIVLNKKKKSDDDSNDEEEDFTIERWKPKKKKNLRTENNFGTQNSSKAIKTSVDDDSEEFEQRNIKKKEVKKLESSNEGKKNIVKNKSKQDSEASLDYHEEPFTLQLKILKKKASSPEEESDEEEKE